MDVRQFYIVRRQIEESLPEGSVVIISLATPDGGRAGVRTEVDRKLAATLIAENRARLAETDEKR